MASLHRHLCFFFQAEDGIRDLTVTGVQTCALPISVAYNVARIFQTNRAFVSEDGPIAARTLGLVIGRPIAGGLHEDIEITNNSQYPVRFNLEIAMRADFADIFEGKSNRIVRR